MAEADQIELEIVPGFTWTPDTPVDAAALNMTARPLARLNAGAGIKPVHLDMEALLLALGDALRGRNYLRRGNFWPQDWRDPAGLECPEDVNTENAWDWWARPAGGAVTVRREEDSPTSSGTWCAEITGGNAVTETRFFTWVPAGVAGQFRDGSVTFSLWIRNMTGNPVSAALFLATTPLLDGRDSAEEASDESFLNIAAGEWRRFTMTFQPADHPLLKNGFCVGLKTGSLNGPLKSIRVAQAQLETGTTATEFVRQTLAATPVVEAGQIPEFGDEDRISGARIIMQLGNSATQRVLGPPPAGFVKPVLGWNRAAGYPEWQDDGDRIFVFNYTGVDQIFTAPVTGTYRFQCWGAGGSADGGVPGGVGGYTWGEFSLTAGDRVTVMVGGGAHNVAGRLYGFGGAGQGISHQHNGGGLSGVFTGAGGVTAGDAARALVIAGGGGAGGQSGGGANAVAGGNGNDPGSSGGQANFQGADAHGGQYSGGGGGGGGYNGGSSLGLGGRGGTGFLHADKTAGAIEHTARPGQVVPGSTDPAYVEPAGRQGCSGLVVISLI